MFDVVLGYGAHEDMVGALLPAIEAAQTKAKTAGVIFTSWLQSAEPRKIRKIIKMQSIA